MTQPNELSSLKVGDEVLVVPPYGRNSISKITKITPSGRIYIGDLRFDKDGHQLNRGNDYSFYSIYPVKEEDRQEIKKRNLCSFLQGFNYDLLEIEKLEEIYRLVKKV